MRLVSSRGHRSLKEQCFSLHLKDLTVLDSLHGWWSKVYSLLFTQIHCAEFVSTDAFFFCLFQETISQKTRNRLSLLWKSELREWVHQGQSWIVGHSSWTCIYIYLCVCVWERARISRFNSFMLVCHTSFVRTCLGRDRDCVLECPCVCTCVSVRVFVRCGCMCKCACLCVRPFLHTYLQGRQVVSNVTQHQAVTVCWKQTACNGRW